MKHTALVLLALELTSAQSLVHAQDPKPRAPVVTEMLASAEQAAPRVADERAATVDALAFALRDRVSIAHDRSGYGIPAAHCRDASEGCDRRIQEFADYLVGAGQARHIDPWLLAAVAVRETMLNPFAVGTVGELGIMQIHPKRPDAKQVRFMRDARYRAQCHSVPGACQREIVEHAAHIMEQSLQTCHGRLSSALGAYNSGRCGGSNEYAKRVLAERTGLRSAARKRAKSAPSLMSTSLKAGAIARNETHGRNGAPVTTMQ